MVYRKGESSGTRWQINTIGRLIEILLDVITNEIMWQGHVTITLYIFYNLGIKRAQHAIKYDIFCMRDHKSGFAYIYGTLLD